MNTCCFLGFIKSDLRVKNDGSDEKKKKCIEFTLAIPRVKHRNSYLTIPVVTFGNIADVLEKYFKKDEKISLVAQVDQSIFTDENGKKVYRTVFTATQIYFPDKKEVAPGKVVKGIKVADDVEILDDSQLEQTAFFVPDDEE